MKLVCDAGSLPHFADHLAPIWKALPDEHKGGFYARGRAVTRAADHGIDVDGQGQARRHPIVMVASYEDHRRAHPASTILVNHGAGQRYIGDPNSADNPSYTGGRDRDRVILHLCPSETDAARCCEAGQPAVAVGVPKLDGYHRCPRRRQRDEGEKPVVAVSFHADVYVCPESRSSLSHYKDELARIAREPDRPFDLLGHGHPRWAFYIEKFWRRLGIPYAWHFDEVLDKADCYVIDNSSTGPEFASTGRPIVWMSAPWYRRDVHHGGRFWEWTDGIPHIDEPDQLLPAIGCALADLPPHRQARDCMVQRVYGDLSDGQATRRAVDAIVGLLHAC